MQLVVKQGREYVLGGRVYKGGQTVDVPDKHARILAGPKGPLEHPSRRTSPVDLPAEVMRTPATEPEEPRRQQRRYRRRDLRADDAE